MHYRLPRGLALRNPSQEPFCGIIGNSVRQVNRAAVATEIPGENKNPMKFAGPLAVASILYGAELGVKRTSFPSINGPFPQFRRQSRLGRDRSGIACAAYRTVCLRAMPPISLNLRKIAHFWIGNLSVPYMKPRMGTT
jgi:hypothetical protein